MGKMQCPTWLKKQIFEWYIYVCLIGRCNYVEPRGSLLRAGAGGVRITGWICTKAHWTCVRPRPADTNVSPESPIHADQFLQFSFSSNGFGTAQNVLFFGLMAEMKLPS